MTFPKELLLRAVWGGRADPLEVNVAEMWECMSRLRARGGFLGAEFRTTGRPDRVVRITSREALAAVMLRTRTKGDGDETFTQKGLRSHDGSPYTRISTTLSASRGYSGSVANSVLIDMGTDLTSSDLPVEEVRWLLGIGAGLVKDMVEAWRPDAVSLDSTGLLSIMDQMGLDGAYPTVGYVSWFSGAVCDLRGLPVSPLRESFAGGVLVGIDPGSVDPVGDATGLAVRVYGSGVLGMVPVVQGGPDPGLSGS